MGGINIIYMKIQNLRRCRKYFPNSTIGSYIYLRIKDDISGNFIDVLRYYYAYDVLYNYRYNFLETKFKLKYRNII